MQVHEQRRPTASRYIALLSLLIAATAFIANLGSARAQDTCQAPEQVKKRFGRLSFQRAFPGTFMFGG